MKNKLQLPSKVIIAGVSYTIKKQPHWYGGRFESGKQIIYIGTKGKPDFQLVVLLHEIIEAILTERNHRYQLMDDQGGLHYLFSFNHQEFINIVKDIALALRDLVKNN